jgi:hypothetical protein
MPWPDVLVVIYDEAGELDLQRREDGFSGRTMLGIANMRRLV